MAVAETMKLSVEVQFAQKLAANEKTLRDRALRRLKRWITVRSASKNDFQNDDMLKLWKGLFYCMWMSDKPLVQEDLADAISGLIHHFQSTKSAMKFVENFLITMGREWFGIDRWRMNKFEVLVRKGISATFEYLSKKNWEIGLVNQFVDLLQRVAIKRQDDFKGFPLSLQLHLAEVYIEEFARISQDESTEEVKLKILDPYCKLLVQTKNNSLRNQIDNKVFKLIMKISDVGLPESNDDKSKVEKKSESEDENDEEEMPPKKKRKKGKSKIKKHSYRRMLYDNERRDLKLPYIKFNYTAIAEKLIKLSSVKGIYGNNRRVAYDLAKKFRSLADGVFPLIINLPEDEGSEVEESDLEDALERYQEFIEEDEIESKINRKQKRAKRNKKRKHTDDD